MVVHYSLPQFRTTVTHSATNYQLEGYHTDCQVILNENAVNECVMVASDYKGEIYLNKADINDAVKVEVRFQDKTTTWRQIFGGSIIDLSPALSSDQGELVTIRARGYEQALLPMCVGQEYGSQSTNPSLDALTEILTDANYGVIPKWVEHVLNTATDSGYSINTTKIDEPMIPYSYIYWAYKPAINCIDDLLDLAKAYQGANAGIHWTATYDGTTCYFCLGFVGNHDNPPSDVWPTWWNTDQAGSTIEVEKDIIVHQFVKQKPDANYVLYHGKLRKPGNGDFWTENQKALWLAGPTTTLADDNGAGNYKVGSYSLKGSATNNLIDMAYPAAKTAHWDITKWGGKYNIPNVTFWIKRHSNADGVYVLLATNGLNYYYHVLHSGSGMTSGVWYNFTFSIGAYSYFDLSTPPWSVIGAPDWSDISYIMFYATATGAADIWVDGVCFNGHVLRGARDDTKIGTQKAVIKLITDDVGKDDSGLATDDSGPMAQLAKAELYRGVTTPIIGDIVVPGLETIMAGQLAHIHASKKVTGAFNIDSDMRILRAMHRIAPEPHGYRTYLTLTDDVSNSRAMEPHRGYNLLLQATNPSFQNRERASLKSRDIDITQAILSKNYAT